jgi:hypothetical protein
MTGKKRGKGGVNNNSSSTRVVGSRRTMFVENSEGISEEKKEIKTRERALKQPKRGN